MGLGKKDAKIAVIGAGISGLCAANYLINHFGFRHVSVFEAQDRIGGRIWTSDFEGGNVEMGAQYFHARDTPVYKMAKQQHILLSEEAKKWADFPEVCLRPGGQAVPEELFDDLFDNFYYGTEEKVEGIKRKLSSEPIQSIGELYRFEYENWKTKKLKQYPDADFDALFLVVERTLELDHAATNLNKVSLSVIDKWVDYPDEEFIPTNLKNGGFSKLVEFMANKLPEGTVKLNQAVLNISHKADKADLKFDDGHYSTFDHVIVTCPLGYLKANQKTLFTPILPKAKFDAIAHMGFGTVEKVYALFEARFWDVSLCARYLCWDVDSANDLSLGTLEHVFCSVEACPGRDNVLCFWVAGKEKTELLLSASDSQVKNAIDRAVNVFFKQPADKSVLRIKRTDWGKNTYFMGSYSNISIDAINGAEILAEPLRCAFSNSPVILFAGEATLNTCWSTVHGAFWSGEREAKLLNKHYSRKSKLCACVSPQSEEPKEEKERSI